MKNDGQKRRLVAGGLLSMMLVPATTGAAAATSEDGADSLGIRAYIATGSTVVLNWDRAPNADSYLLSIPGKRDQTDPDTWHVVTGLDPLNDYDIRVAAIIDGVRQPWSEPVSVSTKEITMRDPALDLVELQATSVTFAWDEARHHNVQIFRDGIQIATGFRQDRFTDDDVIAGQTYEYKARIITKASGQLGEFGEVIEITIPGSPAGTILPAPITTKTFADRHKIVLKMQADSAGPAGITWYEIERDGAAETVRVGAKWGSNVWFTDTGLDAGTEFSYRVRSIAWDGTAGDWTDPILATTDAPLVVALPAPDPEPDSHPTGPVPTDVPLLSGLVGSVVADGTISLRWDPTPGVVEYRISRNGMTWRTTFRPYIIDNLATAGEIEYRIDSIRHLDDGTTEMVGSAVLSLVLPDSEPTPWRVYRVEPRVLVFNWLVDRSVDVYEIERDGIVVGTTTLGWLVDSAFVTETAGQPSAEPLEPNTTYTYAVFAVTSGQRLELFSLDVTTLASP